ncbi:uncharacterized protein A4U43_C01F33030 [Asparagus officinalis]|uniref:Uncharacterized protein n=1 Tax=Asparagus officinalis TaxID=4686 RepID=A0A5P1FVL4_ASPOF|nr:uncharacterized protein A4U43_C01F33030 [Asparagus officinalis]
MVISDQEISRCLESLLRHSALGSVTSVNGVVSHLESELGLDLSHKTSFIRDQIQLFLLRPPPKDHFALSPSPHLHQYRPFPLGSARHGGFGYLNHELGFRHPARRAQVSGGGASACSSSSSRAAAAASFQALPPICSPKLWFDFRATPFSAPTGVKRRGGPGGLSKVCSVSPELQAIVGNSVPDSKRLKSSAEPEAVSSTSADVKEYPVFISDALAEFFGTGEREMLEPEALRRILEYITANNLEDPENKMSVSCDSKLQQLFGSEKVPALGIPEMLARHLFKQS